MLVGTDGKDAVRPGAESLHWMPKLPVCRPCAATVYAECGDVNGKPEYLCTLADEIIRKSEQCLEQMGEYK